jgi:hypothetical protein
MGITRRILAAAAVLGAIAGGTAAVTSAVAAAAPGTHVRTVPLASGVSPDTRVRT